MTACASSFGRLRTVPPQAPWEPPLLCGLAAFEPFTIRIDPMAEDPVWGELVRNGTRIEITWPTGFDLRADPTREVVDRDGMVVAIDGQRISKGGGSSNGPAAVVLCAIDGRSYPLG